MNIKKIVTTLLHTVNVYKSAINVQFVTNVICNRHFHIPLHTLLGYPVTYNVCIYNIYINIVTSVTVTLNYMKAKWLRGVTKIKICYKSVTPVTHLRVSHEKTILNAHGQVKNKLFWSPKHQYAHNQLITKYTQLVRLRFIDTDIAIIKANT